MLDTTHVNVYSIEDLKSIGFSPFGIKSVNYFKLRLSRPDVILYNKNSWTAVLKTSISEYKTCNGQNEMYTIESTCECIYLQYVKQLLNRS